jgi:hypothetical protein
MTADAVHFAAHPGTAHQQLDGVVTDDHAVAVDEARRGTAAPSGALGAPCTPVIRSVNHPYLIDRVDGERLAHS